MVDVGDQLDPMGSGDDGDASPGSIAERVQQLTNGGSLRDPKNRTVEVLRDPELRRRSSELLRSIMPNRRGKP